MIDQWQSIPMPVRLQTELGYGDLDRNACLQHGLTFKPRYLVNRTWYEPIEDEE